MIPLKRDRLLDFLALLAVLFGLLTLASGGRTVFGGEAARQAAGQLVPFVLWFNFVAGFAYVAAGLGLWRRRRWSFALAALIASATLLVFAAFGLHVLAGGAHELRTTVAMALRSGFWVGIAWVCWRRLKP